jgi:hypothetical protein
VIVNGMGRIWRRLVVCVRRCTAVPMGCWRLFDHQHLSTRRAVNSRRAKHGSRHHAPQWEKRAQKDQQPIAELVHRGTSAKSRWQLTEQNFKAEIAKGWRKGHDNSPSAQLYQSKVGQAAQGR